MQIALWSNEKDGAGTTTLTGVLATSFAASHNYRTWITHCLTKDLSMEHYLMKTEERKSFEKAGEAGIEGLFRLLKNGKLSKERVKDYCYSLLSHSNLDFLHTLHGYVLTQELELNFIYLTYLARQFYDIVVIDLEISAAHNLFKKAMKETDILLVVCPNNEYKAKQLIQQTESIRKELESSGTKIFYCVNQTIGSKELYKKWFRGIQVPYLIPFEPALIDQCNRGVLVDYILRRCYNVRNGSNKEYMDAVLQLTRDILKAYEEENKHVI